jgi:hypothetical protein
MYDVEIAVVKCVVLFRIVFIIIVYRVLKVAEQQNKVKITSFINIIYQETGSYKQNVHRNIFRRSHIQSLPHRNYCPSYLDPLNYPSPSPSPC